MPLQVLQNLITGKQVPTPREQVHKIEQPVHEEVPQMGGSGRARFAVKALHISQHFRDVAGHFEQGSTIFNGNSNGSNDPFGTKFSGAGNNPNYATVPKTVDYSYPAGIAGDGNVQTLSMKLSESLARPEQEVTILDPKPGYGTGYEDHLVAPDYGTEINLRPDYYEAPEKDVAITGNESVTEFHMFRNLLELLPVEGDEDQEAIDKIIRKNIRQIKIESGSIIKGRLRAFRDAKKLGNKLVESQKIERGDFQEFRTLFKEGNDRLYINVLYARHRLESEIEQLHEELEQPTFNLDENVNDVFEKLKNLGLTLRRFRAARDNMNEAERDMYFYLEREVAELDIKVKRGRQPLFWGGQPASYYATHKERFLWAHYRYIRTAMVAPGMPQLEQKIADMDEDAAHRGLDISEEPFVEKWEHVQSYVTPEADIAPVQDRPNKRRQQGRKRGRKNRRRKSNRKL